MAPLLENILVAIVVLGALLYLVRCLRGKKKKGGCDSCGPSKSRRP